MPTNLRLSGLSFVTLLSFLTFLPLSTAAPATAGLSDQTLGVDFGPSASSLFLGHSVSLDVAGDAGEVVWVLLSLTPPPANPPLIGGVPLAVDPAGVFVLASGFPLPASGALSLSATIPTDLPIGLTLYLQVALIGPGGPRLTNGLAPVAKTEPISAVDQGEQCGHPLGQTGGALVITDDPSWQAFWTLHTSGTPNPPPPPAIDFTKDAVLAYFMGPQVIHNILLSIDQVVFDSGTLAIDVLVDVPTGTCNTPGNTCPNAIVTVPKAVAGPVGVTNVTVTFYTCP